MADRPVLFWFRDDLRLADNPGLAAAISTGQPVLLVYVLDEESRGARKLGGATRWWLDKSLRRLGEAISKKGGRLILRRGAADEVIPKLVDKSGATKVFWNRRYGAARKVDEKIKARLKRDGVDATSFNASLLIEPMQMMTGSGSGYRVYTPFWRALQKTLHVAAAAPEPRKLDDPTDIATDDLDDWELHPTQPDWSSGLDAAWTPGEVGAKKRLRQFLADHINGYANNRNTPSLDDGTSRLSPHLRFGEIGPAQVWRAATHAQEAGDAPASDVQKFLSELAWRDFSHHLLFHDPAMTHLSWRREFEHVDWRRITPTERKAWTRGQTGYPIVDAGMRELWTTGYMHNRVRMIAASFLTKDLLAHWRTGEEWFWDTLVDADEANNSNGWQWVAGSGADAAPYFRVFNPVTQGETFDPAGQYVRRWVPELAKLSDGSIHHPWNAKPAELEAAGVVLGETYPEPIVDHAVARRRALDAYGARSQGEQG